MADPRRCGPADELSFVQRHANTQDTVSGWYIIDASWMKRWAKYARCDLSSKGQKPGLITNTKLLEPRTEGFVLKT
eukprot:1191311-Amphidinium_carterae.1